MSRFTLKSALYRVPTASGFLFIFLQFSIPQGHLSVFNFTRLAVLLIFSCLARQTFSIVVDTIPPTGQLLSPASFSIITGNVIKFSAQAEDAGSGVKEVRFFVTYRVFLDQKENKYQNITERVGIAREFPYEYIWDCADIPDQDLWGMDAWCVIRDNAGNSMQHKPSNRHIVLDRNKNLSNKYLTSYYNQKDVMIDGEFDDWFLTDSIYFINGNNEITAYSSWDEKNIYFAIIIKDDMIFCQNKEMNPQWNIWDDDFLELFLDTKHDHNSDLKLDDKKLIVAPNGRFRFSFMDMENGIEQDTTYFNVPDCQIKIYGTLNDDSDKDTSFCIEIAIPWKHLQLKPKNELSMGFDISNKDREVKKGGSTVVTWNGNEGNNSNNPSEWGNLVLKGKKKISFFVYILLILIISIIILGYFFLRLRIKTKENPSIELSFVTRAKEYILQNYSNEKLSIEEIARHVNMNHQYFGKIFRKSIGFGFKNYLNQFRVDKAKDLLKNPNYNITEVAFKVGYNSVSYFERIFKKFEKITPLDYKKSL